MFGNDTLIKVSLLMLLVSGTTGCNKSFFAAIDPAEKSKLLSEQYIFDSGGQDPGFRNNPSGQDSGYGQNTTNGQDPAFQTTDPNGQDPSARQPASIAPPVVVQPAPPAPNPIFGAPPPPSPLTTPTTQPMPSVPAPDTGSMMPPAPTTPVVVTPAPTTPAPSTPTTTPAPTSNSTPPVQLLLVCSNRETFDKGVNVVSSTNFKAVITQYKNNGGSQLTQVGQCVEDDPTLVAQIKANHHFSFSKCSPKGTLVNHKGNQLDIHGDRDLGADYFSVDFIADGVSVLSSKGPTSSQWVNVLFDGNAQDNSTPLYPLTTANQALCDENASPLFVDMRTESERTMHYPLTAPWDGVWFDILGQNADVAHAPRQISWFYSSSLAYIVLPNSNGQVLGIDQLFGDNTMGPDGKFASNGYEALAKYDSNGDGIISSEDAVFAKLKIWQDKNHDGKAIASELKSLKDAELAAIDLHYDAKFAEQDIYGNFINYKSVAKTTSGNYRLVFDVWFQLNQFKASQRLSQLSNYK